MNALTNPFPLEPTPDQLRARIEDAYRASGNNLGWRFLYSPMKVLERAEVALIGLNPGGDFAPPEHADFCMETGRSAYRDERWPGYRPGESPLQKQVLSLFRHLRVRPEEVLAGNLVPFRSPSWSQLERPEESLVFGRNLWGSVLRRGTFRVVVGLGRAPNDAIAEILQVRGRPAVPVGWGKVTGVSGELASGGIFVGLPHFSRFPIVDRPASAAALRKLFGAEWS